MNSVQKIVDMFNIPGNSGDLGSGWDKKLILNQEAIGTSNLENKDANALRNLPLKPKYTPLIHLLYYKTKATHFNFNGRSP